MIRRAILLALLVAAGMSTGAGAATTTRDASGTVLLDGRKVFPIVLAKGPDRGAIIGRASRIFLEGVLRSSTLPLGILPPRRRKSH